VILLSRTTLIVSDLTLAVVVILMNYTNGGFAKNPIFLIVLVIIALASCIIRHINYYKHTKRIY
jgi:uncharacterized membrane protein